MDEENKKEESSKSSNSGMYIVFLVVLVLAAGGAFYFGRKSGEAKMMAFYQSQPKPSAMARPSGPPNFKGQKLSDVQMLSDATLIYPGVADADVKKDLINWTLSTTQNSDGTVTAKLTPVGSEATEGDAVQTFTLKSGDKLYFDDLNPNDDKPGMDENTHDDLGIQVDSNGVILQVSY